MKVRYLIFCLFFLNGFFQLRSVELKNAGELKNVVVDKTVESLEVQGKIDARDLKFIVEELNNLKHLDLSDSEIKSYRATTPCFGDMLEYSANELPDYCFFDKEYETIVLPNSLSYIGKGAFAGCDNLVKVVLPENIDSIGKYAFNSCTSLSGIVLKESIKKIDSGAFSRCNGIKELDLSLISPLCEFGTSVFADCQSLETVIVGDKATAIPAYMFAGCVNLKNVSKISSLESIGEESFACTALTEFDFNACSHLKVVGRWAFAGVGLQKIILPESVESLGEGAFFYNESMENITLPASVTKIEGYTFNGNTSLSVISLPASLIYIGTRAFEDNTGMTRLTLDAENVPDLGDDVFAGVEQKKVELKVPDKSVLLYKSANVWKEFNIIDSMTGVDDFVGDENVIKVYFTDKTLNVNATNEIIRLNVYEPKGVCLVASEPHVESVQIDMSAMSGRVYIVRVVLANRTEKTIKLIR